MGFKKGTSMRWLHHDTVDVDTLAKHLAMQLAIPRVNPASMIHPGCMAELDYNDVMIKSNRKDVIQAMIDKIQIIAIVAMHAPNLKPTSVQMTDTMLNLMTSNSLKLALAKSGLDMGSTQAARFLQSKIILLLYVVRNLCGKEREFRDMLRTVGLMGHAERKFKVIMMTGPEGAEDMETWTIPQFMNSLRVQLKKEDHKTEPKEEVMMDIDQEVMIGDQLVPMDEDGWPIFSQDKGSGLHDDHDEYIMAKASADAARPSIARAGDQRRAMELRLAGVNITHDLQAALKNKRQADQDERARKRLAQQAASGTPPPKRRKQGDDKLACPTPSKDKDKGKKGKGKGKVEKVKNKGKELAVMHKKPAMSHVGKHSHVAKWQDLRLVHASGGANIKRRRCYINGVPHGQGKHTLVLEVCKAKCDKTGDDYKVMGELMMSVLASGHFTKQSAKDMFEGALNKP